MTGRFVSRGKNHLLHLAGKQGWMPPIGYCPDCEVVGGAEVLLASPDLDVNAHTDNDAGGASYHYRVAASNGSGPRRLVSTADSFLV